MALHSLMMFEALMINSSGLVLNWLKVDGRIFFKIVTTANGGAALTAYNKLMFCEGESMNDALRQALLRYCELDTMSMVFIWEYFHDMVTKMKWGLNMRYYNYDHLIYKASQTSPTSISSPANSQTELNNTYWYTLDGKPLPTRPSKKGGYIHQGKIRYLDVTK